MSALLKTTLDKSSPSFVRELKEVRERVHALTRQFPGERLITGHKEEGSKVHLLVLRGKAGAARVAKSDHNVIEEAPRFW